MNDVIINKVDSIQRCVKRAREEYAAAQDSFATDYTRQDAAVLNLMRACEQSIDLANYLVKGKKLGIPSDSSQSFDLLEKGGIIPQDLSANLKKMVGFRNTVIHEYQTVNIDIVITIITKDSNELIRFSELLLPYGKGS
jgi:uncharacterized protein YutE (UPF0331/DUF86 family)